MKIPSLGWLALPAAAFIAGCAGGVEGGDPGLAQSSQSLGSDTDVCAGGRLTCFSKIHAAGTSAPGGFAPIGGFGPTDLASAYNLDTTLNPGATVAIVDAFGYPNAESDLAAYRSNYGLPACTVASGCLTIVNQNGQTSPLPPAPTAADDWTVETALDLELASSGCPSCKILLVQANNDQDDGLFIAQLTAVSLGATVISDSWGETEQSLAADGGQPASYYEQYFNHPGVETFVAAGDQGYDNNNTGPDYPSTSEFVTAVGGTTLTKSATAARGWTEKAWGSIISALGAGGSSCSISIPKPSWQGTTKCNFRAASDVAAVGDPSTGLAVYNNGPSNHGWTIVGGTSAASPFVASVYALTGHGGATPQLSYQNPSAFYDVTTGTNGLCLNILCNAGTGWDGPTGNGTPNGRALSGIACVPNCAGKQCGSDGCGGSCGACTGTLSCSPTGQCVCTPQCAGKTCGPDGCGGTCGGVCPGPTVSFTSPASGASLSGTVTVSFSTTNTTASSSLQAQVDSNMLGQATGTSFTKTWDTTTAANGSHNLVGTAVEGSYTGTASLPVTIANPVTVTITSPGAGATVSGSVSVTANARATATASLTKVEVYADSILAGSASASPATVTFDASLLGVGSHTLTAKGYDSSGATGTSAPVQITVQSGSQGSPDGGSSNGADGGGNTVLKGQGCGCGATGSPAPWALLLLGVALTWRARSARNS